MDKAVAAEGHHRLRALGALGDGARMARARSSSNGNRIFAKRRAQVRRRTLGRSSPRPALSSRVRNQKNMS